MFVDQVKILVKGGDGGNGCVSFRREAHVPRGGPDGGVGGKGGDVVLVAVSHQNTLLSLRYQPEHRAERGGHGGPGNRTGRDGEERTVSVPPGTSARTRRPGSSSERSCATATASWSRAAGRGGAATAPSSRTATAPRARPSRARRARSAGCGSTCGSSPTWACSACRTPASRRSLSRLSAARPKVADYPFTTLTPVLGVVEADERTFVAADIPGIIEGAHEGAGLGLQFLRHVERTRVLLHVVDASGMSGREPADDLALVREEVRRYAPALLERPQLVAATKRDLARSRRPAAGRSRGRGPAGPRGRPGVGGHRGGAPGAQAAAARDARREPRARAAGGAGVRIGLYGGTFDPIHLGHLRAAETAREATGARPRGLPALGGAPAPRRAACAPPPTASRWPASPRPRTRAFEAWDAELRRPGPSYTVETVAALLSERPSDAFVLVVGADTWPEMTTWREPQRLLSLVEVAVVDRPGYPGPDPAMPFPGALGVTRVRGPSLPISATTIRELARQGRSVRYLVPDAVADYIVARRLYQ